MGRARLTLKRISNNSTRKSTFMKRRDALLNKVEKFNKDEEAEAGAKAKAEACLIVYDPNGDPDQPVTFPKDLTKEHSLIQRYERQKFEKPPEMVGIQDYFQKKKDVIETEISKVTKAILKIKYPTTHPCFTNLGENQLREFIALLDAKTKACSQRISMLKQQHKVQVNLAKKNSVASCSSQVGSMPNAFHSQFISAPMEPLDDNNPMASSSKIKHDMGSQSQMPNIDPNLVPLMARNNGSMYSPNQVEQQLMAANNGIMDSSDNQVGLPLHCSQHVSSANHVDVPLDCIKQSDDAATDSRNQQGEPDWDSLLDELLDCDNIPYKSAFHNSFLESENVQQGAALNTFTPLLGGFQIQDYNNIFGEEFSTR